MMGLGKPKLHTQFELASFSRCRNIIGKLQNFGELPGPRPLFFCVGFYDGRAKFEVAGFIYYGNIREFVVNNSDKPKWGNPLFWVETTLPLDSQTRCFLFNVQLLWSYDYSKWVIFLRKTAFYKGKF